MWTCASDPEEVIYDDVPRENSDSNTGLWGFFFNSYISQIQYFSSCLSTSWSLHLIYSQNPQYLLQDYSIWMQHIAIVFICIYSSVGPRICIKAVAKLQYFWSRFLCRSCFYTQIQRRWSMMTWSLARRVVAAHWTTAGALASLKAMTRPVTGRVTQRTGCPTPSWEESHLRGKLMCVDHYASISLPTASKTTHVSVHCL